MEINQNYQNEKSARVNGLIDGHGFGRETSNRRTSCGGDNPGAGADDLFQKYAQAIC